MATFRVTDDVYGIDMEMFDTEVLSAYVIDCDEPVLVETGYPNGTEVLRAGLGDVGIPPSEVAHVVVSHIHTDHTGGVAMLTEANPDVSVYVHDATANHLLDPMTLNESSREAMGDHFEAIGELRPVPAENVVRIDSETDVDAGDRTVSIVPTPGHAPDHVSAWDPRSATLFVNEAVGSYYPRVDRWLPPATLPRFDVEAVRTSIDRLGDFEADHVALSHFGRRSDLGETLATAEAELDRFERRIPELWAEQDADLAATEDAVRTELVALDGYRSAIEDFETRFQTRGFLRHAELM